MARYLVEIRLPITQFANVTIEAKTEHEALNLALTGIRRGNINPDWITDYDDCGEPYAHQACQIESHEMLEE